MNDIKRIIFKMTNEQHIEIHAVICETPEQTIKIGQIFSNGAYSGTSSIQICGFDGLDGPWSCGVFNHSQDICLKWNDIEKWLKMKEKKDGNKLE